MTALLPPAGRAALRCQVPPAAALRIMDTALARTATAIGIVPTGAQVPVSPQIAFDRPYLMLVTDAETGEPLFLARVPDPGQ
jgi:serine protease inhibitor